MNGGGDDAADNRCAIDSKTADNELAVFFHQHQPSTLGGDGAVHDQVRAVTEVFVAQIIAFDPEEEGCGWVGDEFVQIERLVFVALGGRRKPCVDVANPLKHGLHLVRVLFGCQLEAVLKSVGLHTGFGLRCQTSNPMYVSSRLNPVKSTGN